MGEFKNRLQELRKRAEITQAELGDLTGISQPAISQIENNVRPLSLDMMRTFARVLNVEPVDLLSDEDNPFRLTETARRHFELLSSLCQSDQHLALMLVESLYAHRQASDLKNIE